MSNDVAVSNIKARLPMPMGLEDLNVGKWRVLCESTFPNAKTADSIVLALDYCRARKLDIFKKPVNIVPMWSSQLSKYVETVWEGINSIQITAARTTSWAGMDEPKWGPDVTRTFEGVKKDNVGATKVSVTYPEYCSVTVYRLVHGQRYAFTETVYWLEAYAKIGKTELPNEMWAKRPRGQLHKCAKAASLRAAFPEEAAYTSEEMEGRILEEVDAGSVIIDNEPAKAKSIFKNASLRKAWFENVNGSFWDVVNDVRENKLSATDAESTLKELAALNKIKFDEIESNGNEHDLLSVDELRKQYALALKRIRVEGPESDEETGEVIPNEFEMPAFLNHKTA